MHVGKSLTALATVGLMLTAMGSASADPYADEVVSLARGGSADGTFNTDGDVSLGMKDPGSEALGPPNWNDFNIWGLATVLGFDPGTGAGGNIELSFTDNICLPGPGDDVRVYDVFGNQSVDGDESAEIEVSNDGGSSYVLAPTLAGPGSFGVDVGEDLPYFNQVRVTAASTDPWPTISGMDLDAVQCLNPVEAPFFDYNLDRCEFTSDFAERDVESVMVRTNGTQVVVEMSLCGELLFDKRGKSTYTLNFDVNSPTVLEGNAACADTSDFAAVYRQDGTSSGADFVVSGNRITATLPYSSLGLLKDDQFLMWVTSTATGPASDSVPNVEAGDRCGEPQSAGEVFSVTAM